jgi:hypothetical protein
MTDQKQQSETYEGHIHPVPDGVIWQAYLWPQKQSEAKEREADAEFANAIDVAIELRPLHKFFNLIHLRLLRVPTSIYTNQFALPTIICQQ